MNIYEKMGVKIVINAAGALTTLGGSRPYPEVIEAMREASESFVVISELEEAASKVIADATGAEAGLVTAGCFASQVSASAACMMRETNLAKVVESYGFGRVPQESYEWIDLIQLLPRFEDKEKLPDYEFYGQRTPKDQIRLIKDEFILQRTHHNHYDNAFLVPGGKFVWVGSTERWDPDAEKWRLKQISPSELEKKITNKTAAVVFLARGEREPGGIPLEDVVEIAHEHGVPVIADAAEIVPPRENLRAHIEAGADLVCFSGGKGIRGPNATGILAGKKYLINLAHALGFPYHGVARGYKVNKEQIVGLITALKITLEQDEKTELEGWDAMVKYVIDELKDNPCVLKVERVNGTPSRMRGPNLSAHITIDEKSLGTTTADVLRTLQLGDPHIYLGSDRFWNPTKIIFMPYCLRDGEEKIVLEALKKTLSKS